MGNQLIIILKKIALIGLVIAALGLLGSVINTLIPWIWITYFFVLLKNLLTMIDFTFNTTLLWSMLGLSLTAFIALWTFKASIFVIEWFNNRNDDHR